MDFDEVKVDESVEYEWNDEKDLNFFNTMVINPEYGKTLYPYLPWEEATTTKPNIAITNEAWLVVYMACWEGSFDLKSMTIAPMYRNDTYYEYYQDDAYYYYENDTPKLSVVFQARGGNREDEFVVEFEEVGEVKYVEFPPELFQDVMYVEWYSYFGPLHFGFDTIDVEIKSPCKRDYNGDMLQDLKRNPYSSSAKTPGQLSL